MVTLIQRDLLNHYLGNRGGQRFFKHLCSEMGVRTGSEFSMQEAPLDPMIRVPTEDFTRIALDQRMSLSQKMECLARSGREAEIVRAGLPTV